jgi:hypothetical protein
VSLGVGSPDAVRLPDHDASAAGCGEKKCYLVLNEHFYANDASGYGARAPPYRDRAPAIVAASEHHSKVLIKVKQLPAVRGAGKGREPLVRPCAQ